MIRGFGCSVNCEDGLVVVNGRTHAAIDISHQELEYEPLSMAKME